MILFWNNTYWAGLADKSNRQEMFHPIPAYCYVINYIVGSVFMSSFIIGVGLNPLIIVFNWSKRKVIISLLFILNASKSLC